jgi:hypothetical protein
VLTALVSDADHQQHRATDVRRAIAAEALGGRCALTGLVHAVDAANGRMAARRRDLAA